MNRGTLMTFAAGKSRNWRMGLVLLLVAVATGSCMKKELVWTATSSFPSGRWMRSDRISFLPDSTFLDTKRPGRLAMVVSLRYAADANLEELPLVVETENPADCTYKSNTLTIHLLPGQERVAHNGRLGIFETADTMALTSTPSPGWNVTLHPLADADNLCSLTVELIECKADK